MSWRIKYFFIGVMKNQIFLYQCHEESNISLSMSRRIKYFFINVMKNQIFLYRCHEESNTGISLSMSWRIRYFFINVMKNQTFLYRCHEESNNSLSVWRTKYFFINIDFLKCHDSKKKHIEDYTRLSDRNTYFVLITERFMILQRFKIMIKSFIWVLTIFEAIKTW